MIIGIDASRAFQKNRTGIEEYSYQVIKCLVNYLKNDQVILYVRQSYRRDPVPTAVGTGSLQIPENWRVKVIKLPYLWTQLGLSLELLLHPVEVLFIPAHTVPIIHPARTVVTIHGLEYEFCPEAYSPWEKFYMRWSIKNSCRWAKKIIAVSNNTKKDLINLYKVAEKKIKVIYEGVSTNYESGTNVRMESNNSNKLMELKAKSYLLFVGRLEERKNIIGIIKAFEILKERYKIPHKLILAGGYGYGKEKIQEELKNTKCRDGIVLPGYISEAEKWELLKGADVFLFPTFYEGFGLPVLEAQSVGCPVVAGNNSSIPEVSTNYEFYEITNSPNCHSGLPARPWRDPESSQKNKDILLDSRLCGNDSDCSSALLVDPHNAEEIADAAYKLISDKGLKNAIIEQGYENVKRFSWDKCASAIAEIFKKFKS